MTMSGLSTREHLQQRAKNRRVPWRYIDLPSFLKVLDLWLAASNISFRHIVENHQDKYIVQHDLGNKWTIYFTSVTGTLLNELGYRMDKQVTTEQTITFEIVKA